MISKFNWKLGDREPPEDEPLRGEAKEMLERAQEETRDEIRARAALIRERQQQIDSEIDNYIHERGFDTTRYVLPKKWKTFRGVLIHTIGTIMLLEICLTIFHISKIASGEATESSYIGLMACIYTFCFLFFKLKHVLSDEFLRSKRIPIHS